MHPNHLFSSPGNIFSNFMFVESTFYYPIFLKSIIKRSCGSLAYFSHKFKINLSSSFEIKIWFNVKSGNIKCNMPEKRNSTLYTILKLKWILSKKYSERKIKIEKRNIWKSALWPNEKNLYKIKFSHNLLLQDYF